MVKVKGRILEHVVFVQSCRKHLLIMAIGLAQHSAQLHGLLGLLVLLSRVSGALVEGTVCIWLRVVLLLDFLLELQVSLQRDSISSVRLAFELLF